VKQNYIPLNEHRQMGQLLRVLAGEIVDARIHFRLYQDLRAALPEYVDEFNQSKTFWSLTLTAHLDCSIVRLCKIYDQYGRKPTVGLPSLLETISQYVHFFQEAKFRDRLSNNQFVDSLAAIPRKPGADQLEKDLVSVKEGDPLVKKLIVWRHNFYSHLSQDYVLRGTSLDYYPLSTQDIEALLQNAVQIINRYCDLFSANVYSTNVVGKDDYKSLLNAVRQSIKAQEDKFERERAELTKRFPSLHES
jgi:hypothetical protein